MSRIWMSSVFLTTSGVGLFLAQYWAGLLVAVLGLVVSVQLGRKILRRRPRLRAQEVRIQELEQQIAQHSREQTN